MYHPIKCGCKKISSSVDMVETVITDYMSKPIFLHNKLAHDDASPFQVGWGCSSLVKHWTVTPLMQVRFPSAVNSGLLCCTT